MTTAPIASERTADVAVSGSGSVYLFALLTNPARTWVNDNVSDDRQMFGSSLVVEHRYVGALIEGMEGDGLIVDASDL